MGSWAEPASTNVKKEKTGASGRSQTRRVRPLSSFFTVMRFSKDATSWVAASVVRNRRNANRANVRCFIGPPTGEPTGTNLRQITSCGTLKLRGERGRCQTSEHVDST